MDPTQPEPPQDGDVSSNVQATMLYVGNLSPFVTDQALREIFQAVGPLREVKIIRDKKTGQGAGYGFVTYEETDAAERAVQTMDGRLLYNQQMRVNWAYQSQNREELKSHFQIFVGDLGNTVTDTVLLHAFTQMSLSPTDARVMWDNSTGRSRGYGFVSFKTHEEATKAIEAMNGQFIGSRRVRCGWAQHKQEPQQLQYDVVHQQDPLNVNVYVGNISAEVSDTELRRQFSKFGTVVEVKIQRKGGYGFVRFQRHEDACKAICGMSGQTIGGRQLKCSWGKAAGAMMGPPTGMLGMGMPPQLMHGQPPMYLPQGSPHMMLPQGGMHMGGQQLISPQTMALPGMMGPGQGLMMPRGPGGPGGVGFPGGHMQGMQGQGGQQGKNPGGDERLGGVGGGGGGGGGNMFYAFPGGGAALQGYGGMNRPGGPQGQGQNQ